MRLWHADAHEMFLCATFWWLTTTKCRPIDFLPLDDTLTVKTSTFDAMVPRSVPKIDDHDDNNYEHLWSSGTTYPCHGWDPGSIPGKCTFWLHVPQIPSSYILYFDIDHSDFSSVQDPLSFLFWLRTIIRLPIPDFFFLSPDASDPKITSVDVLP